MKEYILVGDYGSLKKIFLYSGGFYLDRATRMLGMIKLLPEYKDYTNIHIEEVEYSKTYIVNN